MGRTDPRQSLPAFLEWLSAAPESTLFRASDLRELLAPFADVAQPELPVSAADDRSMPPTWRERLWTVPADTRLGVREVAEALGRPVSFVYRGTSERAGGADRIPHRKLAGELTFTAGDIRTWLKDAEEVVAPGPGGRSLSLTPRRAS